MQPPKAAHPMKAWWQNVLEEATKELEGFQLDMLPCSGGTLAKSPAQSPVGQQLELAVAGGGFEYVTAQVAQSSLAATHRGAMDHPALCPHFGRAIRERFGHLFLERLAEERAATIAQDFDGQEEVGAAGDPLALIQAQTAAWY